LAAWSELARGSNMSFTDRRKLAHSSLKQFGGLTVTLIQEPLNKTRIRPKGKNASTGSAKKSQSPCFKQSYRI